MAASPSVGAYRPTASPGPAWARHWGCGAALVLVVAALYAGSLQGAFQYDDYHSIVRNPHIRDLANVPRFFQDPATFSGDAGKAMYRPLLLTSLALNHALHGDAVAGYHVVNIALHAAAVLLLWRLGALLLGPRAGLAAALLFAVHPLMTEPVDYISSRSELLLGVFFLAALWAHVAWAQRRAPHLRWLAVAACALALLSKATAAVLAPALLVVDVVALGWRPAGVVVALRRHGIYWALTGLWLATVIGNGFLGGSLAAPVRGLAAQLWTQVKAPAYYASLLAVPHPLSVEHPFVESAGPTAAGVLGGALILTGAWLTLRAWRRLPAAAAATIVGGLVLLPTTVMPLNLLVNERRLYLAAAAVALAVASLVRRWRLLPVTGLACLLGILVVQRNEVWASPVRLWEAARDAGASSYRTWVNLGKAYQEAGRTAAARQAYERALALDDDQGDVYNNLGVLLHESGQLEGAVAAYREALRRTPDMEEIQTNLADAYMRLGRPGEAVAVYRQALAQDSTNGAAWNNMGQVLMRLGRHGEAAAAFQRAARWLPDRHEPFNNLGNALDAAGQLPAADRAYREALARAGDRRARAVVHANLGETLRRLGDPGAAAAQLDSAIALGPTATAFDYRGRLAWDRHQLDAARAAWSRAVELDPGRGSAWTGLGEVALEGDQLDAAVGALQQAVAHGGGTRARVRLGVALERAGRPEAAQRAYEYALRAGRADDPQLSVARQRLQALGPLAAPGGAEDAAAVGRTGGDTAGGPGGEERSGTP